jgi:hypothetical protein
MIKSARVLLCCAIAACGGEAAQESSAPAPAGEAGSAAEPVSNDKAAAKPADAAPARTTTPQAASSTPASAPAAQQPAAMATQPPAAAMAPSDPAVAMAAGKQPLAMDECGLKTNYTGDEYCILPPPPDKGFQLHIGPSNYENPEAEYLLQPGEENVVTMAAMSGNDKDVHYYYRQYRMRPGSHHVIISVDGRRIGGIQNLARDEPENGVVAPEDEGVGLELKANTMMDVNLHYYNFTDKPSIREVWVNYWYKDAETVTDVSKPIYSMTSVTAAVAKSHVIVGATCPVTGDGRVLNLYGHRHLNNKRFSVWRTSAGQRDLVFDDYDSEHPGFMAFNSLTMNPAPDPGAKKLGGASGILDLKNGDTLDFECEIVNNTDKNFRGLNEAEDDEMCIMIGDSVSAQVAGRCTPKEAVRIQ